MVHTDFSDSYVIDDSVLETYIGSDPRASAIALKALAATSQEWYCSRATLIIDAIPLQGHKLTSTQERQFPRKYPPSFPISSSPWGSVVTEDAYGYIYMSSDVPQDVIDACCEQAIAIYDEFTDADLQLRRKLQESGVSSVNFRGRSESYIPGSHDLNFGLCSDAYRLLEKYISNSSMMR
jgi:hypothetical protein